MTLSPALLENTRATVAALDSDALSTIVLTDTPEGWQRAERIDLLVVRHERLITHEVGTNIMPQQWPDINGTIQQVTGAHMTHRGWVLRGESPRIGGEGHIRAFGAPINPTPVDGHYYRIIGADVSNHYIGFIAQYHAEGTLNWQIVHRADGLPISGPDGWQQWDWCSYVEVNFGETPEVTTDELLDLLDDPEPASETVGIPTTIPVTELRETVQRYAVHPDDQQVPLNPEPVVGDVYVAWFEESSGVYPAVVVWSSEDKFERLGYLNSYGFEADYHNPLPEEREDMRWVAMRQHVTVWTSYTTPDEKVLELNTETDGLVDQFDGMLDALDQMRNDRGWCSEYGETMERGRMTRNPEPDPEPERHAFDIEVTARFEWSGNPSSGSVDEAVAEWAEVDSVDVSDVTFTGTKTFTITGREADDEDDARQGLNHSDVESELDDALCEFNCDRLVSFEINSIREDEDYDFG